MQDYLDILESTSILFKAYREIIFLLDQGYPKRTTLNFVANRYSLKSNLRNILNRSAFSENEAIRINSLVLKSTVQLMNKILYIDAYNQLVTFFSLIMNEPLIISRDGLYRDIFSSIHPKEKFAIDENLIQVYIEGLKKLEPKQVIFYLDAQKSHSRIHKYLIESKLQQLGVSGSAICLKSVDKQLKQIENDIILTHDSIILLTGKITFDFTHWYHQGFKKDIYPTYFPLNFQNITWHDFNENF